MAIDVSSIIPHINDIISNNETVPSVPIPIVVHMVNPNPIYDPPEDNRTGTVYTENAAQFNFTLELNTIATVGVTVRTHHNPSCMYHAFSDPELKPEIEGAGPRVDGGYWIRSRYTLTSDSFTKTHQAEWVEMVFNPQTRGGGEVVVQFPYWETTSYNLPSDNLMVEEPTWTNWTPPEFHEAVLAPCPPDAICSWNYEDTPYTARAEYTKTHFPEYVDPTLWADGEILIESGTDGLGNPTYIEATSGVLKFSKEKQSKKVYLKHMWTDISNFPIRNGIFPLDADLDQEAINHPITDETSPPTPISGAGTYEHMYVEFSNVVPNGFVEVTIDSVKGPTIGNFAYGVRLKYDATDAFDYYGLND